ncbi:MAG TPA: hypothetical protein VKA15_17820, partial [Isosphaeraceae bacterium]|nr:hypothetical protein [Isosphaeraceae bacterium]
MPASPSGDATIVYRCPSCGQNHSVAAQIVGRRARCRNCGHVGRIVEAGAPGSEPSVYELAEPSSPTHPVPPELAARPPLAPRKGIFSTAWSSGAIEESQISGLAFLLIVLSAADLLMTVTLLRASPRFFEGNP